MVQLTMIVRVADSLPLAASMQEDEQSGRDLQRYQSQAKQLCRKLNEQSPARCTLEAGETVILNKCSPGEHKRLLCGLLQRALVDRVDQMISHLSPDTYIQKTKKSYIDSRARRNLGSINSELHDVQRIMVANIEEVLQRGEALSALDSKASNLSSLSKKYRSDAKYLNTRSTYAKVAAGAVIFITLIVYVRFWWL
uniref:Vesicle-trafficking protein SEC22b-A n=1 Tax=Sinocyclocheilus grahami TaxID=75366 RepID=A0A672PKX4_SINGR